MTLKYGAEFRSIELWNNKLENMLTILTADDEIQCKWAQMNGHDIA